MQRICKLLFGVVEAAGSASASADSPMNGSGALDASSSQVSASCNEMSIGMDYSVELSTELDEKCDFVEVVRPVAKRGLAGLGVAGTVGTIEEAAEEAEEPPRSGEKSETSGQPKEQVPAAPLESAPDALDALDALMPKGEAKKPDALDSLMSSKPDSRPGPAGPVLVPSPKAKESKSEKEDDEYADASFDGSMSVPESINEEASGSDAWGSEEDV